MACRDNEKYYWWKKDKNYYNNHKFKSLHKMKNGYAYSVLLEIMKCESTPYKGILKFSETRAYTVDELAAVSSMSVKMVKNGLQALQELELITIDDYGVITINDFEKCVGSETGWANKKRKQAQLPKLIGNCKRLNAETLLLPNGKTQIIDEKRYGGNGMLVMSRANGVCELCGSDDNVRIHHNNGYSNEVDDLIVLCGKCHGLAHNKENKGHLNLIKDEWGWKLSTKIPPESRDKSKDIRIYILNFLSSSKNRYTEIGLSKEYEEVELMMIKAGEVTGVLPSKERVLDMFREVIDNQDLFNKQGYLINCFKREVNCIDDYA